MPFKPVVIIPHYRHPTTLATVVAEARAHSLPVLVVDDGSGADSEIALQALEAQAPAVTLLRRAVNGGKGAAVKDALRAAHAAGFSHALQIDADGQHQSADIPRFLAAARAEPTALITGQPIYDESVPKSRLYGRYLTHIWVWIETLSLTIRDAMCGFRLYPLPATVALLEQERLGDRMDFDIEILVHLYWRGLSFVTLPTRVSYPADGISHFDVLHDNLKITGMHSRLVLGMLRRLPERWRRRARAQPPAAHWSGLRERGSRFGIALLFYAYRLLGRTAFRAALLPVIAWYTLSSARARHASLTFLGRVHDRYGPRPDLPGAPTWQSVYRHLFSFAESALDKLAAWTGELDAAPRFANRALLDELERDARGALLVGAHLGNLELCRALSTQRTGRRVHAVVHDAHAAKFNDFLKTLNPQAAINLIAVQEIGPDTAIRLKRLIDEGDWLVIVGDRTPAAQNGRTLSVPFLQQPAPFAQGPWILAHLLACPVYLLFCLKMPDQHYTIYLERFAERIELPRERRSESLRQWVTRFAARLEHYAALAPYQWFNFYDFWQCPSRTPNEVPYE